MVQKTTSVLIVEEHPTMHQSLCTAIASESDFRVLKTSLGFQEIIWRLRVMPPSDDVFAIAEMPEIILLAPGNPGDVDLQAIQKLRKNFPEIGILALTRDDVAGQARDALQYGAHRVLAKFTSRAILLNALRALKADCLPNSLLQENTNI